MKITKWNICGDAIDNSFSERVFKKQKAGLVATSVIGRRKSPLIVQAWAKGKIPVFDQLTQSQSRCVRDALQAARAEGRDLQKHKHLYLVADTSALGFFKGLSYPQPMLSVYSKPPVFDKNSKNIRWKPDGFVTWMNTRRAFRLFLAKAIYRVNPRDYLAEEEAPEC